MQVETPHGLWRCEEDFNASATIQELIDFLIEEMGLMSDRFDIIDGNGKVVDPSDSVGIYCDSYLELICEARLKTTNPRSEDRGRGSG